MHLHYDSRGHGTALLILHGLFGSLDNWSAIAHRLAGYFRVVSVDLRNHGESPHSPDMSYELLAADLLETMNDLRVERAHILGHSLGGKTAMWFALRHPVRLRKLVVVDIAPGHYEPKHRYILDALLALDLKRFRRRQEIDRQLSSSIPDAAVRAFLLKNARPDPAGGYRWRLDLHAINRNYDLLNAALPPGHTFHGATLFVRGAQSDYLPPERFAEVRQLFPTAKISTVDGAGHWVHVEQPELFSREILSFLQADVGIRLPE